MKLRRALLLILCAGSFFSAGAQFQAAYIGVNGLTCSQCSRTVEVSIRKLDFVADVQMNLQHTEGKIILKNGKKADMEKIAQAVVDAGFSVRYLSADFSADKSVNATGQCFKYKGDEYVFTEAPKQPLSGTVRLKFVGKKYLPKNEYKKLAPSLVNNCSSETTGKTYFVAM